VVQRSYRTAVQRWEGIGPYYAMFPTHFADEVIARYSDCGHIVLDPFAGRGTAVFSAAHQGRKGIGVEVNPVGWVYGMTKLQPASKTEVESRILELGEVSSSYHDLAESLPHFFHHCFSIHIRQFLVASRALLDWKRNTRDRTLMALLLVYLHGKQGAALSNQMRQTKSMAPDYAVRWWQERGLTPPDVDPVDFLTKRLAWRYAKGLPETSDSSSIYLGDSTKQISYVAEALTTSSQRVRLLFTSPPYFALTNYHYDQWLRLWLLGGAPSARRVPGDQNVRAKFEGEANYRTLLKDVFSSCAKLMASDSVVYVRTGRGKVTFDATLTCLRELFPNHQLHLRPQPYTRPTQTTLFGDFGEKTGEMDIVLVA
jgi:DNA methylase